MHKDVKYINSYFENYQKYRKYRKYHNLIDSKFLSEWMMLSREFHINSSILQNRNVSSQAILEFVNNAPDSLISRSLDSITDRIQHSSVLDDYRNRYYSYFKLTQLLLDKSIDRLEIVRYMKSIESLQINIENNMRNISHTEFREIFNVLSNTPINYCIFIPEMLESFSNVIDTTNNIPEHSLDTDSRYTSIFSRYLIDPINNIKRIPKRFLYITVECSNPEFTDIEKEKNPMVCFNPNTEYTKHKMLRKLLPFNLYVKAIFIHGSRYKKDFERWSINMLDVHDEYLYKPSLLKNRRGETVMIGPFVTMHIENAMKEGWLI